MNGLKRHLVLGLSPRIEPCFTKGKRKVGCNGVLSVRRQAAHVRALQLGTTVCGLIGLSRTRLVHYTAHGLVQNQAVVDKENRLKANEHATTKAFVPNTGSHHYAERYLMKTYARYHASAQPAGRP